MFTKKKRRKMQIQIYSTIGATSAVNAGLGITAVALSNKARKISKETKERIDQLEIHVSKSEEQLSRVTKAVKVIQDTCIDHGLLKK